MTDMPVTQCTDVSEHARLLKEISLIRMELIGLEERYYKLRDEFYMHEHREV